MKLYNVDLSPNCIRVRAVADELGLALEIVDVDMQTGTKTDAYLAMNPNGKVPVLEDNGMTLWESRAINNYLASKAPDHGLYPDEPVARALVDQWLYWGAVHFAPAFQKVTFERVFKSKFGRGEPDESAIVDAVAETNKLLGVLDGALNGRDWIAGSLSVADFAIATAFVMRDASGVDISSLPNVMAWIDRMEARESWQKAAAPVAAFVAG